MNIDEYKLPLGQKASLVSIVCERFEHHATELETNNSLKELRELLRTLGIVDGEEYVQNRKSIDPSTMLGEGKLKEIAALKKKYPGHPIGIYGHSEGGIIGLRAAAQQKEMRFLIESASVGTNGKDVLVNQVGCYGINLGRIDFYFEDAKSVTTEGKSIVV